MRQIKLFLRFFFGLLFWLGSTANVYATSHGLGLEFISDDVWKLIQFTFFLGFIGLALYTSHLIAERKTRQKELQKNEQQFESLFAGNKCVELIVDPQKGRIIEANQAAEKFYGYSREELLSLNIFEINMSTPEEIKAEMVLAKHEERDFFLFEHRMADGTTRYVEVYSGPIVWNDEKVLYSIVHDISARKEAEQLAFKLSETIKQADQAVIITDREGVIEYVNPAYTHMTGFSASDSVGRFADILNHDDASMWEVILNGEAWHGKIICQKKNGLEYPTMVTVSLIRNDKGETMHLAVLQLDLSEYENLENQLQQAQKMEAIGTLVGGIAHDFNNMLAGIVGNLYLAKKQVVEQAEVVEKLNNIEQLSYRASEMVGQLLTFARKSHVQIQPIDLGAFLSKTMRLLKTSVPENIHVIQNVCSDRLCVEGDTTLLHQVLMNLMNNARDAVADAIDPEIQVCLEKFIPSAEFLAQKPYFKHASYAKLSVCDNGHGISEADTQVLFEPFFTTKEQGKGTGLGLSMVFGAVKTHRGYIEVDSTLGKGAAFSVYLPLLEGVVCQAQDILTVSEDMEGQGETILLVDDEEHVLETGKDVLQSLGYQVMTAMNGLEAVDIYSKNQREISLILTDVIMPKLGGIEAVSRIRQQSPDVKVIFSTGYDNSMALQKEGSLQHEETIRKPYQVEKLAKLLRVQLSKVS